MASLGSKEQRAERESRVAYSCAVSACVSILVSDELVTKEKSRVQVE